MAPNMSESGSHRGYRQTICNSNLVKGRRIFGKVVNIFLVLGF